MSSQTLSSSTIKLNLPSGILQNAEVESNRIGISLQDFIRMLMATYFANSNSIRAISRDRVLFSQAQEEIRKGEYTKVSNASDLETYLRSIEN